MGEKRGTSDGPIFPEWEEGDPEFLRIQWPYFVQVWRDDKPGKWFFAEIIDGRDGKVVESTISYEDSNSQALSAATFAISRLTLSIPVR